MPRQLPNELIFQVFALLIAFILVHGAYVTVVRPQAAAFVAAEQVQLTADPEYVQQRNFYVVIKDYEQETCFVLMLWAIAILGYKGTVSWQQRRQLEEDLLQLPGGMPVGPEDTRELTKRLDELPKQSWHFLLPRALRTAISGLAPPAMSRIQPPPCGIYAHPRGKGWSPSFRRSVTLPGPFPRLVLSARYGVLVLLCPRRTGR